MISVMKGARRHHLLQGIHRRAKKAGLPPGTLVFVGEKKVEQPKITVIQYDETHFEEKVLEDPSECLKFKDSPYVTWINIDGVHDVELIARVGEDFGLHPLLLEDILSTDQRPKIEDFDSYLFTVVKMLYRDMGSNEIRSEQISMVLGRNLLISFQEKQGDVFNVIRERLRTKKGRVRKMRADYLAYALIDAIVDHYFVILEFLGERIEYLQDELMRDPTQETLHAVHGLKRQMIFLRRAVWPLREMIIYLERGESELIDSTISAYLRDVYDNTIEVMDSIETFRDILASMVDVYLSSINNRMNEIIKVLTMIATIFIPLSFVAGIYGMNFEHMPELSIGWAYFGVLAVMATIGTSMLFYFRKKRWI